MIRAAIIVAAILGSGAQGALAQQQAPVSQTRPTPGVGGAAAQNLPPTKKTSDGVCHGPGTSNYERIKGFVPFVSLEDCLKSGGRLPKRY